MYPKHGFIDLLALFRLYQILGILRIRPRPFTLRHEALIFTPADFEVSLGAFAFCHGFMLRARNSLPSSRAMPLTDAVDT